MFEKDARDDVRARGFVVGELAEGLGEKIAGVLLPIIMFRVGGVPTGMAWSQG